MKLKIWLAMLSVYIVWGSTYLAIAFAVQTMPPFLMAAARFLVAGGILFIYRRWISKDPAPRALEWRSAAVVGLFLLLGGNGGVVWAEQRVPSGIAALLVGASPLFMVLIDAIRPGGVRPSWQTALGVLVGFGGIALLIGPDQWGSNGQGTDLTGMLVLILAAFLWAAGSLYSRNACLPGSPLLGTGMEMLTGGAGLLVLGTLTGEWARLDLSAISTPSLLGLVYLIFFGSLVGFASYTWLLRNAPTPLVSTYAYVNPLIAILLGNLLASEPITLPVIASALIILSSVALINMQRSARQASSRPVLSPACED